MLLRNLCTILRKRVTNVAHFEKVPERPTFDITDDYGHCANLTAEQAYELLQWLYRSDELFQAVHPDAKQEQPSTWLAETHQTMVQALDSLVAKPKEHAMLPSDYQAEQGDIYIQEVRAGRF